jgi:hypothetical protein
MYVYVCMRVCVCVCVCVLILDKFYVKIRAIIFNFITIKLICTHPQISLGKSSQGE